MDGTTCQDPTILADTSRFDYLNLDIYVSGNKRTDEAQTAATALASWVNSINTKTPSSFRTKFLQTLDATGLTPIFLSTTVEVGPVYTSQSWKDSDPDVNVQATYVTISDIAPTSSGYVFAIADPGTLNVPKYYQIKKSMNANNDIVPGSNAYSENGAAVSIRINGLEPLTTYQIYYYASNLDLSQYSKVTPVRVVEITTKEKNAAYLLAVSLSAILFVVCMLVL